MTNILVILFCKLVSSISKTFNLGSGSTWPGHIALSINRDFIRNVLMTNDSPRGEADQRLKIVLIAGTNGKTTTGKLIQTILEHAKYKVFQNQAGANLLNGIASSLILHSSILSTLSYDYCIFEIDENTLPLMLNEITPDYVVLLNLFRDQLDRYGEVNIIAYKWQEAVKKLSKTTTLILNADDPQIAHLVKNTKAKTLYFGLNDKSLHRKTHQYAVDSTYCPNCGNKLFYKTIYFSHLGDWKCNDCLYKRPKLDANTSPFYPLAGVYNRYNTLAAVLLAKVNNISNETIQQSLKQFSPAFGRQEMLSVNGKNVQIFLSKNPTSFNESLRTVKELNGKHLLLVLNDRIPDGRDVSWIWDVDFEELIDKNVNITASGDRAHDIGLRIKYTEPLIHNTKYIIQENLNMAITSALDKTPKSETLYVLPTYSAMLEVRKILTGRKIL